MSANGRICSLLGVTMISRYQKTSLHSFINLGHRLHERHVFRKHILLGPIQC